jgi:hypothetical protein
MADAKHTQGPWTAWLVRVQRSIVDAQGRAVAYTHGVNLPEEESAANAMLIASAPELLEALTAFMRNAGLSDIDRDDPRFERARFAIAKATGSAS